MNQLTLLFSFSSLLICTSAFAQNSLPNGNQSYPVIAKLCAASLAKGKPYLTISEVMLNQSEGMDTQIDCTGTKPVLRMDRLIYGNSKGAEQVINVTSAKLMLGTENGHPSFDLLVFTPVSKMIQHGEMNLNSLNQPVFYLDDFNGIIGDSKDSGVYYTETQASMVTTCASVPYMRCSTPISDREQSTKKGYQYQTPLFYLSHLANKLPSNADLDPVDSRVDFQAALTELSYLAIESSTQQISDLDAAQAIEVAKAKISLDEY